MKIHLKKGEHTAIRYAAFSLLWVSAWVVYAAPFQFTSDAEMVVLHVRAENRKGTFPKDLAKDDFHVLEDGVPQTIHLFQCEDQPVSVGLVVDNSGSMRRKRADVATGALAFVQHSNPSDEMFVVNFNDNVSLGLPSTKLFSADPSELRTALSGSATQGRTSLYDALLIGMDKLKMASAGKRVLILISDGGDNASKHTLKQVLQAADSSQAVIYTVGIFDEYDTDKDPKLLRRLAKETGGKAYFPEETNMVVAICERIAADIRNQYTIGYVPTNRMLDGTYRSISVSVQSAHHGKIAVRTRAGYIASPPDQPKEPII